MGPGQRGAAWAGLALLLLLVWLPGCRPSTPAPLIVWQADHDVAIAQAKTQGQPVIVSFSAAWCGTCQRLGAEVWPHPRVRHAAARFAAVQVDLTQASDGAAARAKAYGIESLPAAVFIDSAGTVMDRPRLKTYLSPKAMDQLLRSIP